MKSHGIESVVKLANDYALLDAEKAKLKKALDVADNALKHYADDGNWGHHSSGVDGENKRQYVAVCYEGQINTNGFEFAQQARTEIQNILNHPKS